MTPTRQAALAAYRAGRVVILLADAAVLAPEIEPPARITAAVHSSRDDRRIPYCVQLRGGVWTCTCDRPACAHVAAVQLATGHPSAAAKEAA